MSNNNLAILAKAILELSRKVATTWEYGGEQITSSGVSLDDEIELQKLADGKNETPTA